MTEISIRGIYPTDIVTQVCNSLIAALFVIEKKANVQEWLNTSCCMYTMAHVTAVQNER